MKLSVNSIYWVEHPNFGTIKATLAIVPSNQKSLCFVLEHPILRPHVLGFDGVAIGAALPLLHEGDSFTDILTGSGWKVYDKEPVEKIPTR